MTQNFLYWDINIACAIPESSLLNAMEAYDIKAKFWDTRNNIKYFYITYKDRISKYSFKWDKYIKIKEMDEDSDELKSMMREVEKYFKDIMTNECEYEFELKISYVEYL